MQGYSVIMRSTRGRRLYVPPACRCVAGSGFDSIICGSPVVDTNYINRVDTMGQDIVEVEDNDWESDWE